MSRNKPKVPSVRGTKVSVHNSLLFISSGIQSLDALLGGGIPVGSLVVVEEDSYNVYCNAMLKIFLSQSVALNSCVLLGNTTTPVSSIIKSLPSIDRTDDEEEVKLVDSEHSVPNKNLEIAWRYKQNKAVNSVIQNSSLVSRSEGNEFCFKFDFAQNLSAEAVGDRLVIDITNGGEVTSYKGLLDRISSYINDNGYSALNVAADSGSSDKHILRIVLQGFPSLLFSHKHSSSQQQFLLFLYSLKCLLRFSYSTCVLSVPLFIMNDLQFRRKIIHQADICYGVEAFTGTAKETSPAFKEYHGLFHIHKLPRLNCISVPIPETTDLAFKLKRKKYVIEKLHLPPDLSDTVHREQDEPVYKAKATIKKSIEF